MINKNLKPTMKISIKDLYENTKEKIIIGSNLKPKSKNGNDSSNILNNLEFYDWVRHTSSFHNFSKKVLKDQYKRQHPATFEEELPFYYIEFFTQPGDIVFDPFIGTGSTSIAASLLNRRSIGIEINQKFLEILKSRFELNEVNNSNHIIFPGDCLEILSSKFIDDLLKEIDEKISFTITSPPYFNMLYDYKNAKNQNLNYATNYGNNVNNLEKISDYNEFLEKLGKIFKLILKLTKKNGYLVINVQNFWKINKEMQGINRYEYKFFAWDLSRIIIENGWDPRGEQIWAYPNKKLFGFGYPDTYLSNITHSYVLIYQNGKQ